MESKASPSSVSSYAPRHKYTVYEKVISEGNDRIMNLAVDDDGKQCACKSYKRDRASSVEAMMNAFNQGPFRVFYHAEKDVFEANRLVFFSDYIRSEGHHQLLYKYEEGGSLLDRINEGFREEQIRSIIRDILVALRYLKSKNIIHTALSPDHILIRHDGDKEIYLVSGLEHCTTPKRILDKTNIKLQAYMTNDINVMLYSTDKMKAGEFTEEAFDRLYPPAIARLLHALLVRSEPAFTEVYTPKTLDSIHGISLELVSFLQHCISAKYAWGLEDMENSDFVKGKPGLPTKLLAFPCRYKDTDKQLGKGTFSVVKQYTETMSPTKERDVAIKKIASETLKRTKDARKRTETEIQLMHRLNRESNIPYVLRMYNAFEFDGDIYVVMEYLSQSLQEFFESAKRELYPDEFAIVAWKVASALNDINRVGILHRDVKPENILVVVQNERIVDAKLCDFNVATSQSQCHMSRVGSPVYMAPEVPKQCYDRSVDVWSYGVLLYYLLKREKPNDTYAEKEYSARLRSNNLVSLDISPIEYRNLANDCLKYEHKDRLTIEQVVERVWQCLLKLSIDGTRSDSLHDYKDIVQLKEDPFACLCTKSETKYVMLRYNKSTILAEDYARLQRGVVTWRFLYGCDHLAKLVDAFFVNDVLHIIQEHCEGPTLAEWILKHSVEPKEVLRVGKELATGISELHLHSIANRDISPATVILVSEKGKKPRPMITSFALAKPAQISGMDSRIKNDSDNDFLAPEHRTSGSVAEEAKRRSLEQTCGVWDRFCCAWR